MQPAPSAIQKTEESPIAEQIASEEHYSDDGFDNFGESSGKDDFMRKSSKKKSDQPSEKQSEGIKDYYMDDEQPDFF